MPDETRDVLVNIEVDSGDAQKSIDQLDKSIQELNDDRELSRKAAEKNRQQNKKTQQHKGNKNDKTR